ncbi:unnamed protein product [Symbiodinium sp. CCMP2592]|nr:unnamed protein product [Symbiodinium sp. CCMP2592]
MDEPSGKGKGKNKGKAQGKGHGLSRNRQQPGWSQDHWTSGSNGWGPSWTQDYNLPDLVQKLSSMAIKHEYAINSIMQDHTLYLFVKPGDEGLIPILFATSDKWHKVNQTDPSSTTESLRLVMMKAFLIELGQRLKATMENQHDSLKQAKDLGWLTDQGLWKTLTWNPAIQDLQEQPGGRLHKTEDLIGQTVELRKLNHGGESVSLSISSRLIESTTDSVGSACHRDQYQGHGESGLGTPSFLDRLRSAAYNGLQTSKGAEAFLSKQELYEDGRTAGLQLVSGQIDCDLLWSSVAGGIPTAVRGPPLCNQLQYLLQQLSDAPPTGLWEWYADTGLSNLPPVEAPMILPMQIVKRDTPPSTVGCLREWGAHSHRPVLRQAPHTLYAYAYTVRLLFELHGETDVAWFDSDGEACPLCIQPLDGPAYACLYEVRSIILCSASGDRCGYDSVHRKMPEDSILPFAPALSQLLDADARPCIVALRRCPGQVSAGHHNI